MATIQDVFSHIYTTEAHLGEVPVKNGQIILCADSEKLYIDHGTTRVSTSDVVQVENQEALPLAPLDKFYITQDTKDIFFYINGTWAKLTDTITDYTAFNVYAHDTAIPAGYNAVFDETFMVEVPASMTHKFIIRSRQNKNLQDVMVNWGDGAITSLKDDDVPWETVGDRRYTVSHTYSTPGTYTVKVYGTTFFGIWHYDTTENILCEALTSYLPVSSRHQNLGDFLRGSQCLTWLECGLSTFLNKNDLWGLCQNCRNLTRALGFSALPKMYSQKRIFDGCINLTTTDFVFSSSIDTPDGYAYAFHNCEKLTRSLKDFFPSVGFLCKKIDFTQTFQNTPLITWSDEVPQKLWKDPTIEWVNTNLTFDGCSDNLRSHIPTSWGGTSTAEIVGNLPVPKLSLNGILPNTANGLLMLNASGKVDSSLLPEQAPTNIDNYTSNSTIRLTSTAGAVNLISNTGEVGLYSGSTSHIKANVDTIELTATTLSFNGNDQNVAGGIAVIDKSTGKLPESILPEIAGTDLSNYVGGVDITATGATYIRNGQTGDYTLLIGMDQYYGLNITNTSSKEITLAATLDGEGTINLVAPTLKMKTTLTGTHFFAYDADHISVIHGTEVDLTGGSSSLSIHDGLSMIVAKGGFGINASGKNILLTCGQLYLNNHGLNSASGLVQLNSDGKIPTNLYDATIDLSDYQTNGPIKLTTTSNAGDGSGDIIITTSENIILKGGVYDKIEIGNATMHITSEATVLINGQSGFVFQSNGTDVISESSGHLTLADGDININGTLHYNGASVNAANGLVQLDDNGKILASQLPEMTQSWTKVTINQSSFATSDDTYGGSYYELDGICSVEVYDADGYKVEFDVKCDFTNSKTRIYIPSGLTADTISNWTLLYLAKTIA